MISFLVDGIRFNFRAAAVIIHDGHVLLHRAEHQDYWALPGGRVEAGEASATAVARELAEELGPGLDARVERLLWVVENFHYLDGERRHSLGMYYLVTLGASSAFLAKDHPIYGIETDVGLPVYEGKPQRLIYQWFPLAALVDTPVQPPFLCERLAQLHLPAAPELVTHEPSW